MTQPWCSFNLLCFIIFDIFKLFRIKIFSILNENLKYFSQFFSLIGMVKNEMVLAGLHLRELVWIYTLFFLVVLDLIETQVC